jgi:hypothetical protein
LRGHQELNVGSEIDGFGSNKHSKAQQNNNEATETPILATLPPILMHTRMQEPVFYYSKIQQLSSAKSQQG